MYKKRYAPVNIRKYGYAISFGAGLVLAALLVNFLCSKNGALVVTFGRGYFENYVLVEVRGADILSYVLVNRIKLFLLWLLIGCINDYQRGYTVVLGLLGLFFGVMLSALTMNYGALGLALFLFAVFPHGLLYFFSGFLAVKKRMTGKLNLSKSAVIYFLAVVCLLLGCVLEAYLSPMLIRNILK